MDILARAKLLEKQGKPVCHMEIGEPDFTTLECISNAGIKALSESKTHYTQATGLPVLREAIAAYYSERYAVTINPRRVIVTPGASGAIQMAMLCLLDQGDEIMLADPGYPCNRNIAELLSAQVQRIAVGAETDYQLNAELLAQHWNAQTRVAMVASPSNPTGTLLSPAQIRALGQAARNRGGYLVVDEIYQGLVYDAPDATALQVCDDCFVINSFSKYFGMTGWRVGWMVVPEEFVDAIDRISQNIFLAPPTMSQYAALEAISSHTRPELDRRRDVFRQRRDYLLPALLELGFGVSVKPEGAFYIYADCSAFTDDAYQWVQQLLQEQAVAVTPGIDFGEHKASRHCRFAYTQPIEVLQQAVERLQQYINR